MIRDDGTPQIMDAGLSLIVSRADFTNASVCGPCRWMPPEVLEPSDDLEYDIDADSDTDNIFPFSRWSDVYSFGMTVLEVLTGKAPYHHRRYDTVVILDIIHGTPPPRPAKEVVSDGLWTMLHHCWKPLPESRPPVRGVELWLELLWKTEETRTLYKLATYAAEAADAIVLDSSEGGLLE
jgi:serine/threonine protein kinase